MAKGITEIIKDFKDLHPRAYKKIRADVIDEFADYIANECNCSNEIRKKCGNGFSCLICDYADRLKELK